MSIKFKCLCGQKLAADDDKAGKRVRCPRCGKPVTAPNPLLYHTELNELELPEDDAETRKMPLLPPE